MDGFAYFFWMAKEAFAIIAIFPPAGILMVAGFLFAFALLPTIPEERRTDALMAVFLPLILPVLILCIGVGFVHTPNTSRGARGAELVVATLLFAHLPLAILLAVRLKGARWFAVAASAAIFGYSLGAAFMSTMSVTGNWL